MPVAPLTTFARLILIPGFIALSIGACAYRHEKGVDPDLSPGGGGRNALGSPSYAEVKVKVLNSCMNCHHHTGDYDDYSKAFGARDIIFERVFGPVEPEKRMPLDRALTAAESTLLRSWLDADAPEEAREAPKPEPSGTVGEIEPIAAPTWAQVQAGFFVPHCTKCHNERVAKKDLNLTNWEQTRKAAALNLKRVIVDGDMPENKALYNRITPESKLLMFRWILGGMPGP